MTTPTRLAPARRAVRRAPTHPRAPAPPRDAPRRPRQPVSFERILLWSLGLSAVVHLLILIVSPLFIAVGVPPGSRAGADAEPGPVAVGLRAIVPVRSDDEESDDPAPEPAPAERSPARPASDPAHRDPDAAAAITRTGDEPTGGEPAADGGAESEPAPRSVGDALRPGYSDRRLWVNPRELRIERERPRHEVYMEHLQSRIDALNDSTYGRGPDTDWTFTDDDGRRWGVSEDGVHLGGITIPRQLLPIPSTGTNAEQEENRERARQREEIIRQEDDRAREEARERSRKAAEQRRKDRGGGG